MIADDQGFDKSHGFRGKKKEVSASEILQRQPPYELEAEMGVIGSILLMPDICDEIASLKADDFYDDANRMIYTHLRNMYDTGEKIDVTLLVSRMRTAGEFEKAGGAAYLGKLSGSVANAAHAVFYAEIVTEKAVYRRLIESSTEILRDAYEQSSTAKELCSQAEQKVFAIMDGRSSSAVSSISDVLHQSMDRMEARMRDDYDEGGVETGLTDFDQMTGGVHPGALIILAARPAMGKTALAMNIAENVSLRQNSPVLFVSLEMSSIELADRLLCSIARVNGHKLRAGAIRSEDRDRLVLKAGELSQAPLFIDDSPSRTVSEIGAAARRIKRREEGLGMIVIDYLQLIEPDNSRDPRQEQVAKIARRLKGLARELDVPVLCLSQLNRQAEEGKDHRPKTIAPPRIRSHRAGCRRRYVCAP